jgi:hypothetical protein
VGPASNRVPLVTSRWCWLDQRTVEGAVGDAGAHKVGGPRMASAQ